MTLPARREFLRTTMAALVGALPVLPAAGHQAQDSLPGGGPAGRLWDPERAGRPVQPVTARDNTAALQAIEKQLRCTCNCGLDVYTCRTTDFSCTTSPAMHRQVMAYADEGKTAQQILDAFVDENGQSILMAPPKKGFNLAGYFVPSIVIVMAAALLLVALRRWTRHGRPVPATGPGPDAALGTPEELERLRHELDRMDA